jgi:hypothetical protein
MDITHYNKTDVSYKKPGKDLHTHEQNICSEHQYELLKQKYQQITQKYCRRCDDVTDQGLWEDNKPEDLLSGCGEFFRQCTVCGSFNERPIKSTKARIPEYAIKIGEMVNGQLKL